MKVQFWKAFSSHVFFSLTSPSSCSQVMFSLGSDGLRASSEVHWGLKWAVKIKGSHLSYTGTHTHTLELKQDGINSCIKADKQTFLRNRGGGWEWEKNMDRTLQKGSDFWLVETGDVMAILACGVNGEHLLQFCDNNLIIRSVMRNSLRDGVWEQGVGMSPAVFSPLSFGLSISVFQSLFLSILLLSLSVFELWGQCISLAWGAAGGVKCAVRVISKTDWPCTNTHTWGTDKKHYQVQCVYLPHWIFYLHTCKVQCVIWGDLLT